MPVIVAAVAAGRGVGVLPAAARERLHPGVRHVALADAPPVDLVLLCPTGPAHPLADRFEEVLRLAVHDTRDDPQRGAPVRG